MHADEILAMTERDQEMRRAGRAAWDPTVDERNTARLREIVAAIGWPTRSKVGQQAEHAAWLLAQHADADRAFQREALALMSAEPTDEVCPKHLAYLEDRLRVADGRPQRYGTQLTGRGDELEPLPIEDRDHVDERRKAVGMGPLAEYLAFAHGATRERR